MGLAFANEVSDSGCEDENFERGNAAFFVNSLEKILRDDAFQSLGEGCANFVLLLGRKDVNDTIDGLGGTRRVQRAEYEMAGAGGHQCQLNGFQVAQLTDEDDIRVFAQGTPQRGGKRFGVDTDFAVVDETVFAFVDEFDRVLDGDDVVAAILVAVIDHGREGRGFAGTRWAGHNYQPAMEHGEFFEDGRERGVKFFKVFKGKNFAGNLAEHGADAVFLVEEIGAETGNVRNFVAEIDIAGFFELFDLIFWRDFVEHLFELVVFERGMVHALEFAVDSKHRVVPRGKVHVGRLLLEHQIEECINLCHKIVYGPRDL